MIDPPNSVKLDRLALEEFDDGPHMVSRPKGIWCSYKQAQRAVGSLQREIEALKQEIERLAQEAKARDDASQRERYEAKRQVREALRPKLGEPVAVRHNFDGHGWLYIDQGSGSDWLDRAMARPDAEPLYAKESE